MAMLTKCRIIITTKLTIILLFHAASYFQVLSDDMFCSFWQRFDFLQFAFFTGLRRRVSDFVMQTLHMHRKDVE